MHHQTAQELNRSLGGALDTAPILREFVKESSRIMPDFLIEIGTEEIPDWMIATALESFRVNFQSSQAANLNGTIDLLDATPRRLAMRARGLDKQMRDIEEVVPGPYVSAGDKAAQGFARKHNLAVTELLRETDARGERYFARITHKGESAQAILSAILPEAIARINWPKSMVWRASATGADAPRQNKMEAAGVSGGALESPPVLRVSAEHGIRFIRPIRWLVALLDDAVLPIAVAGIKATNTTRGHRILGSKDAIPITVSDYEAILRDNFVLIHSDERRQRIQSALGSSVQPDAELLNTLVFLTEFPSSIRGSFDPSYLELPKEILSTVMRRHQRYFTVLNGDGSLAPNFVAVTNTNGDPDGLIRQGNERVLRARFNDARFFWQVDQRKPLADRLEDLAKVTFQARLGTYKDKTARVASLATQIGNLVCADGATLLRAATLSKTDLTTDMVKEFTELQGVVGGLYARAQGHSEAVATAIYDQYKPLSMEDSIPRTLEGQVLSLADKLDTLRQCFQIGLIPTGSKDPFALRRAAQGVIKILFEARLPLPFLQFVGDIAELAAFMKERMEFYLREVLGYAYDEVNAVLAAPITTLADLVDRADGVHFIRPTADFEPLAASFKRIKNILKQAQVETAREPKSSLLHPGPEKALYDDFVQVREETRNLQSYRQKLSAIASLRPAVDLFFDKVLVNDPDPIIRQNRLALLSNLLAEFSTIADFSEIVTQGAGA